MVMCLALWCESLTVHSASNWHARIEISGSILAAAAAAVTYMQLYAYSSGDSSSKTSWYMLLLVVS